MSSEQPSLYRPLDASKYEIRLIKLALNEREDEIVCRLIITTIENAPPYEALSYTWGSEENKVPILVNGQTLEVTRNLYQALLTLRRKYTRRNGELHTITGFTRTLWIDAICIDQSNLDERTSQVRLMWSIYARAREVVVYLGDEEEDGSIGMEMARLLDLHFEVKNKRMIQKLQRIFDGEDPESGSESAPEALKPSVKKDRAGGMEKSADERDGPSQSRNALVATSGSAETERSLEAPLESLRLVQQSSEASRDEKPFRGRMNMFMMTKRPVITLGPDPPRPGPRVDPSQPASASGRKAAPPLPNDDDDNFERLLGPEILASRPELKDKNLKYLGPVEEEEQSNIPLYLLAAMHGNSWGGVAEDPSEWLAFQKLMERPWWRRVWVIQEVAAASGQVWVACGPYWLRWEAFLGAANTITHYQNHPFFQQLNRFGAGARWIHNKSMLKVKKDGRLDSWGGLLNIIYHTAAYEATDPRDKIFALLGFTPSIGIAPDYQKTAEEVFETLVRKSIQDTRSLMMALCGRKPKLLGLPSWVPDFSLSLPLDAYNIRCPMGFFGADGNNWQNLGIPTATCALDPGDKPGELRVRGFGYDKPLVLRPTWQAESSDRQWKFFKIIEEYRKLLDETDRIHFPHHYKTFHRNECFWRTLIWNANAADRYPAPANFGSYLSQLMESEERLLDMSQPPHEVRDDERTIPSGEAEAYYAAFVTQGLNRRFFITEKGHLGSGPPEMRLGDIICVIFGSKTPPDLETAGAGVHIRAGRPRLCAWYHARRGPGKFRFGRKNKHVRRKAGTGHSFILFSLAALSTTAGNECYCHDVRHHISEPQPR